MKNTKVFWPSALTFLGILAGCDLYPPVKVQEQLTSPTPMNANGQMAKQGPNCASCHNYPLSDVHHAYHLLSSNVDRKQIENPKLNGMTTCMDCHFNSIRHFSITRNDTIWGDANGNEIFDLPGPTDKVLRIEAYKVFRPLPYGMVDTTRGRFVSDSLDTVAVHQFALGQIVEWMTGSSHMNGKVDVVMAPNNVLVADSLPTAYRPKDYSCSTVACHSINELYRWGSPKSKVGHCPSIGNENPECLTPATVAP
jgi:hypothetical protein